MSEDFICAGPLTEDALSRAVGDFLRRVRPRRERLFDYYRGEQPVPKGEAVRGRPNNRLRVPFPRYITEVQTGYFLGLPPALALDRPEDAAAFSALSSAVHWDHLLFDAGRGASICGTGFVLVWPERERGLRACRCDPLDCFAVRSAAAGSPLLGTVRLFRDADGGTAGTLYQRDVLRSFSL